MTYEYAEYFKLLLLCGYKDDLQQYIDNALAEQDPISDIVLELNEAGTDDKKMLSILNEYLRHIKNSDIDYDESVFNLVMSFLKRKYNTRSMSMKSITDLMYQLAVHTEQYSDEPWYTMYTLSDLFDEAESGYIDKSDYQSKFEAFINDNVCFCNYPPVVLKESFFKKLLKRMKGNH